MLVTCCAAHVIMELIIMLTLSLQQRKDALVVAKHMQCTIHSRVPLIHGVSYGAKKLVESLVI